MSCSRQDPKVLSKGFVHFGRSCCGGSWTDRKCRPLSWFTEQIWPVILCLVEMFLWLDIIGGALGVESREVPVMWTCVEQHHPPGEWPGWASGGVALLWEHQAREQSILRLLLLLYLIRSTVFSLFSSRFGKASSKWTKGTGTVSNADAPGKSTAAFPHPTRAIEQGQCAGGAYTWEEGPFSETCGIWGFQQGNVNKLWAWWEFILLWMFLLAKSRVI